VIPVIVTITEKSMCSSSSYFDYYIMGRLTCSASIYCDNNGVVYLQLEH
jgi:hypothetical protein